MFFAIHNMVGRVCVLLNEDRSIRSSRWFDQECFMNLWISKQAVCARAYTLKRFYGSSRSESHLQNMITKSFHAIALTLSTVSTAIGSFMNKKYMWFGMNEEGGGNVCVSASWDRSAITNVCNLNVVSICIPFDWLNETKQYKAKQMRFFLILFSLTVKSAAKHCHHHRQRQRHRHRHRRRCHNYFGSLNNGKKKQRIVAERNDGERERARRNYILMWNKYKYKFMSSFVMSFTQNERTSWGTKEEKNKKCGMCVCAEQSGAERNGWGDEERTRGSKLNGLCHGHE